MRNAALEAAEEVEQLQLEMEMLREESAEAGNTAAAADNPWNPCWLCSSYLCLGPRGAGTQGTDRKRGGAEPARSTMFREHADTKCPFANKQGAACCFARCHSICRASPKAGEAAGGSCAGRRDTEIFVRFGCGYGSGG